MGHRAPFFASLDEALERTRPDAVWICTPPDSHAALTEAAVKRGVAVFVEKPLAHALDDARKIEAIGQANGAKVACGYAQLCFPVFAAAREQLDARVLGRVTAVRSSMYLSQVFAPQKGWIADPARSGGGVVANLSSHLLAQLRAAFGQPVKVRATWKQLFGVVEDELTATLATADGLEIGFETSWSVSDFPISSTVIEVEATEGRMKITNDAIETERTIARDGRPAGRTLLRAAELPARATFELNGEFYDLEDAEFVSWVAGGPPPRIDVGIAADVQRTMTALYDSARTSGAWTEVPR
jgi:predicted dehydrogenase